MVAAAEVRVPQATVTFKFDPPNGSVILEKSERTRVRSSKDGSSVYGTDRDEMIREWMFQAVAKGYRVASIVRASREEIDKKPFENPLKRVTEGKSFHKTGTSWAMKVRTLFPK